MENNVQLFNTLTRKVEQFVPNVDGKVNMYTCGPTVYHFAHIGNLRSYIMEDVLEKTLRYAGYDVKRVMNITDVGHLSSDADTGEDKMLKGAKREHKTVMQIAQFYTDAFFSDCEKLNIKRPDVVEPATNCIDQFIHMIETLLEKGYAYIAGENVYFDTSKLEDYYVFSSQTEKELMVGVRDDVAEDTNKRSKSDFVLWFTKSKFDNQELKWESPWGVGYPGWHIECSAMSAAYLGEVFDIHGGGLDLIFPHHENEIAQSEGAHGHAFVNYWMHNGFVRVDDEKMSKSLGNFFTIRDVLQKYDPEVVRFFILRAHYRSALNYSDAHLDDARHALTRLYTALKQAPAAPVEVDWTEAHAQRFKVAMDDDFNTAEAVAVLFDLANESNRSASPALAAQLRALGGVLGLLGRDATEFLQGGAPAAGGLAVAEIEHMIAERAAAKKAKNYAEADRVRAALLEAGVVLEDGAAGTTWRRA